jgi:hypothetical protein
LAHERLYGVASYLRFGPQKGSPGVSWVIRETASGKVICETFDPRAVALLNKARYEAVPIQKYLAGLNSGAYAVCEQHTDAPERGNDHG